MQIRRMPPPSSLTSMLRAPASSAFSSNSLRTEAGRSMTSPAAIWLISVSGRGAIWRRSDMEVTSGKKRQLSILACLTIAVHASRAVADQLPGNAACNNAFEGEGVMWIKERPFIPRRDHLAASADSGQGRIGGEIIVDARENGPGNLALVSRAAQEVLLLRIADKGRFHQNGRNIGRLEHGKPRLFYLAAVDAVDLRQRTQHAVADFQGIIDLRGSGHIQQHTGRLAVVGADIQAADQIGCILFFGQPASGGTGRAVAGQGK